MRFFPALLLTVAVAGACGGEAFTAGSGGGGAGGGAGAGGSAATGGASNTGGGTTGGSRDAASDAPTVTGAGGSGGTVRNSGDCETSDDCGGDPCVELIVGGYRVCVSKVPEATTCSVPAGQCCKSTDCTMGPPPSKCVLGPAQPSCAGPVIVPTNVCVKDACKTAADCAGDNPICQPAGVFGSKAARCITGGCRFDRDCLGQGASCAPVVESCCGSFIGLYCVYPNGCRRDADCGVGQHCAVQGNRTTCVAGGVACPASL